MRKRNEMQKSIVDDNQLYGKHANAIKKSSFLQTAETIPESSLQ